MVKALTAPEDSEKQFRKTLLLAALSKCGSIPEVAEAYVGRTWVSGRTSFS
jgi:hypothetical protein